MSRLRPAFRPALRTAVLLALAVAVAGTSGCGWLRKKDPYAMAEAERPLEVPPELDTRQVAQAEAGSGGSVTRSSLGGGGTAASNTRGFTVDGGRDAAYARVGQLLEQTSGLTIASRAQLLGAYDVDYRGAKFLVRVSESAGSPYVSAVDPRGQAAQGEGPAALIAALKEAMGGR